jgi:cation:H+ antiporter
MVGPMLDSAARLDEFMLLVVGLAGLWFGTQLVVQNSVRLARRLNVSEMFLGLTLVALGTDLPELLVAVDGALHNLRGIESSGVVIGTAVGSSVGQISIVIGLTAVLHYLTIGSRQLRMLGVELVGSCLLLFLLAYDGGLGRVDGLVLSLVFLIYLGYTVANRNVGREEFEVDVSEADQPLWRTGTLLTLGLAVVVLSSELTVDKALELSRGWGLQQSFVGAVLVGLGTSTPELAVSLRAIAHGRTGLSVGNVVGSNIFDLLVPTGVAAVIAPLTVDRSVLWYDLPALLVVTLLVIFLLSRKRGLQRGEGAVLVVAYLVYAAGRYLLAPA